MTKKIIIGTLVLCCLIVLCVNYLPINSPIPITSESFAQEQKLPEGISLHTIDITLKWIIGVIFAMFAILVSLVFFILQWLASGKIIKQKINEEFQKYKDDTITPLSEEMRIKFINIYNDILNLQITSAQYFLSDFFDVILDTYRFDLEIKKNHPDDINQLVLTKKASFQTRKQLSIFLIAIFSKDKDIVADNCQKIFALLENNPLNQNRLNDILDRFIRLLEDWNHENTTKVEINRVINKVRDKINNKSPSPQQSK